MKAGRGRTSFVARLAVSALVVVATLIHPEAASSKQRAEATLKIAGARPRALVIVDGVRFGRVADDGSREIKLPSGSRTIVVRQPGLADSRHVVTLVAGRAAVVKPKAVPLHDEAELAYQRGDDLAQDGKSSIAAPEFAKAIELRGGTYAAAQIGLARLYLATKKTDEATELIAAVLKAEPKNGEALTVSASILRERGFADEAAVDYRKAIALSPTRSPEAHAGLAIVLTDQGLLEDAVAEYGKAIAQNLDAEALLYQLRGSLLERLNRRAEAVASYERFLMLAPSHALAPAVRSIVERLRQESKDEAGGTDDVNPYAPPE